MLNLYDVIFSCSFANYWWVVEENLPLDKAEQLAQKKNKGQKIHGNCCQYYIQKRI
jgi:hypothetical protein